MNYTSDSIREMERMSIRAFVEAQSYQLVGRVLDFGSGKPGTCRQPQPYRDLVKGEYVPYDLGDAWPIGVFDAILCTQVIQYIDEPLTWLMQMRGLLREGGSLIVTGPTNWTEIENSDKQRFTLAGIQDLLARSGFSVESAERRAQIDIGGFVLSLGFGVVARL